MDFFLPDLAVLVINGFSDVPQWVGGFDEPVDGIACSCPRLRGNPYGKDEYTFPRRRGQEREKWNNYLQLCVTTIHIYHPHQEHKPFVA
uniref:Uncharacterized protein n=1 Tax=Candidatus Kentrum sp. TUN TaxID=2126343 RepID=A0A450ZG29_9GAMM|nr:MAG: hypothetical protein BECKTUN1418F_GA0071002_101315 [Candidatus Kentron sp. TUN]VFK53358.1 MAG: hypothetical protein BECKTUN1418E_GA0071001_101515 [Candidatus Kentron sp. TUN]